MIIDDGSTDNTSQIIKNFKDERIRNIQLENNLGTSHARNSGIEIAKGEFIAFLDCDDLWLPSKLEKQMLKFQGAPLDVGIIYYNQIPFVSAQVLSMNEEAPSFLA
ncbi:MAG: glycosyltransferase family 2 protein [Candidatus Hermodarchaeota archaeon]